MIIGIDNALSGGLVALSRFNGDIIDKLIMPVNIRTHTFNKVKKRTVKGKTTKEVKPACQMEIDAYIVTRWIKQVTNSKPCVIAIEECPEHAQQKSVMRSMAMSYGILIGAIEASLPEYEIYVVRSGNSKDSWQRHMLGKLEQGKTKEAALAAAEAIWLEENWLASPRSRVPHDGLIDAALIAEHVRRIQTQ